MIRTQREGAQRRQAAISKLVWSKNTEQGGSPKQTGYNQQAVISTLVWSKNTEQAAHYHSKKPATRGRGFFRCAKSNRCGFWAWSGLDDVAATGPLASDEPPILPPDLLTSPHLLSQSPPPSPSASQVETCEGVRACHLEAENAALRMELSSLQGKLSQCKDDLSLAEEKYDRLVAGIGRLLAAD
ncbi:hypothetical protein BS47DRAFT_1365347 [Hydnum rufescens UP504]|uniref:Uncharacterized protein n=1 Tax=Hydnum rufescens UP504 TaxID=1448309 RepID=A0A9P6ANY9_9AGAM|nr:hypothetical protein BS47DRAFT_1365342 [Hydnum rufescens UP504]KAF9509298.1 hypothetical protein BS47DRAFT_1365347 [Hydnum rufescens UP504]